MTVTTLLWASDPVWALKATDQAGASHRAVITNSEVAANALDSIAGSGSDAGAFNSAVQASNVQAALNRVDSTFNALNTALMNS